MQLITDPALIDGYLTDASNTRGWAEGLLRPRDAEEVAEILSHCQSHGIPLTVTAMRTSTTGAPVPEGGWLMSMERLSAVHGLDRAGGGVILGQLQAEIERSGSFFPPDPTSRHECSLGAAIACNASGARSFRYGPTRPWIEAVQYVLADGTLGWADRSTPLPSTWPRPAWSPPHVKTAAGYEPADNLLDLLIGSEGTLGVITEARLRLRPLPAGVMSLFAFFPDTPTLLAFVQRARDGAERGAGTIGEEVADELGRG